MASETVREDTAAGALQPEANLHATPQQNTTSGAENAGGTEPKNDNASSVDGGATKEAPPVVVTKKEKLKRHCRRFWWLHLIIALVLLVILLPILFKVIIPAIVQDIVDKQELPPNSGSLQALSPTQMRMSLKTSLDTPLGVRIDPMQLHFHDVQSAPNAPAWLTLDIPEQHVHHTTPIDIPAQTVTITNQSELVAWFNEFFDQTSAPLLVEGDPSIHLGTLHYNAHLEKTIQVPGLNYLNGFGVQDLQFVLPPDAQGRNLKGHLNIPNAGVLTLGLGNLTVNLLSGPVNLGMANIYDVVLEPGNNTLPFEGVFHFDALLPNIAAILDSQKDALATGNLQLSTSGNSTIVNGVRIPYIEQVLNNKNIKFDVPVLTMLGDVLSGLLNSGNGSATSLGDILHDVVGNSTVFENLLQNWNETNTPSPLPNPTKAKRGSTWKYNLLRMGLRMGQKAGIR